MVRIAHMNAPVIGQPTSVGVMRAVPQVCAYGRCARRHLCDHQLAHGATAEVDDMVASIPAARLCIMPKSKDGIGNG